MMANILNDELFAQPIVAADSGCGPVYFVHAIGPELLHSALGIEAYRMNRPLWLDAVYLVVCFAPCALGAYVLTSFSINVFNWPRWSFIPVCALLFVVFIVGWLFLLALWQRWRASRENK